ncbi:plasmid replication, integration and excision activator [Streptosporangium sp. NPDC051022]|uniref:plasmid replication, integration and excision activator n=1 Tax=Streptosporangium sp. NPDC051022 TaxID=3155752 RepID=UPI00341BD0F3
MDHALVFPHGCYVSGEVTQALDFDASTPDRPVPTRDKATGLPIWQVPVMDGDPSVKVAAKSLTVKVVSPAEPVIPPVPAALAAAGLSLVPVVFEGMTVTPWVTDKGRVAYSFKASGVRAAVSAGASTGKGREPFSNGE